MSVLSADTVLFSRLEDFWINKKGKSPSVNVTTFSQIPFHQEQVPLSYSWFQCIHEQFFHNFCCRYSAT